MKTLKTRVVLLFVLTAFISINCSVRAKKINGTAYFMKPSKGQLRIVIGGENKNEPEKFYYKGKDYSSYIKEFLELKPAAFVSDRILILSEEGVIFQDGEWKCNEGIIIYPRETELLIIEATDISYSEKKFLKCSNAIMKIKKVGKEKN